MTDQPLRVPQTHRQISAPAAHTEDETWLLWQQYLARHYQGVFYEGNPLVRFINLSGHRLVEKPFGQEVRFERVLEVGCGSGEHLRFVRHAVGEYVLSDLNESLLELARAQHGKRRDVIFRVLDARRLPYPDGSFDRLISVYNLEHLTDPHLVLKEWARVVRPDGVLSLAVPTEGGLAWSLGRYFSTRRTFRKLGLNYDYIVAREHVNTCYRLRAFIRYYFPDRDECWFPTRMPSTHTNLVFACTIRIRKHL